MRLSPLFAAWLFVGLIWLPAAPLFILMAGGVVPWVVPVLTAAGASFAVVSIRESPETRTSARLALVLSLLPLVLFGLWMLLVVVAYSQGGATIL